MNTSLPLLAEELRVDTLEIFKARGFGHVGGAMSVCELIAVLYGSVMRYDSKTPAWYERDRLVCSKGHAGPTIYSALAKYGFFDKALLKTLNHPGTTLPSHCDMNLTPGVDMTTGSLGQGVSTAVGLAIGQKLAKQDSRTYLIIGDGECNEGQVWEGLMLASHKKLDNLIVFCDRNRQQLDGWVENVLETGDMAAKFESFGFYTQTINGHSTEEIAAAIAKAQAENGGKPSMIVMNTVKGYGCALTENQEFNHHVAFTADDMENSLAAARERLEKVRAEVQA